MYKFDHSILYLMRGAAVQRYHASPTLIPETVGHHSHGVATLLNLIYPDASKELLVAGLHHDLAEQYTGDIPAPAKREMGIRDAVQKYESEKNAAAGFPDPVLTPEDLWRLKFIDSAHGALFCLEELECGNRRMWDTFRVYMSYLSELLERKGPEVKEALLVEHLMKRGDRHHI
jgi:5'-deoxynucleotidase YfbR-like HD superfamily hydrolase